MGFQGRALTTSGHPEAFVPFLSEGQFCLAAFVVVISLPMKTGINLA